MLQAWTCEDQRTKQSALSKMQKPVPLPAADYILGRRTLQPDARRFAALLEPLAGRVSQAQGGEVGQEPPWQVVNLDGMHGQGEGCEAGARIQQSVEHRRLWNKKGWNMSTGSIIRHLSAVRNIFIFQVTKDQVLLVVDSL